MGHSGRLVIVREGHGELGAIETLVAKLGQDLGLVPGVFASIPQSPRQAITDEVSAVRAARIAARYTPDAILLTADLDDGCPADSAPVWARAVRSANVGIPVAVVLFHREFETLALSVASSLAGRTLVKGVTLADSAETPADPEATRDAKGWVTQNLMGGVRYKPTTHQLPLTRLLGVDDLRRAGLSSFRRLEHALAFLAEEATSGRRGVYPQGDRRGEF